MITKKLVHQLNYLVVAGNVIFVLWILYNGLNEGFQGTLVEIVSSSGLIGLLTINSILLLIKTKHRN